LHLGEAYLHNNQVKQATSVADLALEKALHYHQRGAAAWCHWLLGEVNARADHLGAAEDHYSQAMALASELGMAPLLAHCHFGLGKGYSRAGRSEQSQKHLDAAAALYQSLSMPSCVAEIEMTQQRLQVTLQP